MTNGEVPLLRASHLSKEYTDGHVHALVDVSLEIQRGEYIAIVGPSGSGKSTLLSLLGTLDDPTSGSIEFEGKPFQECGSLSQLRSQKIGFIFQSFYLLPTLTALENVQVPMFGGGASPKARVAKARELLEAVEMADRSAHLPNQLSVGQRQRVAIARALANDPLLLLADEPTGNLDTKTARGILDLFARLHESRRMTLVVVTHSDEVASRAERIICVCDGRIESDTANVALLQ
jgi:putative ABC transport system ATP-binding protein